MNDSGQDGRLTTNLPTPSSVAMRGMLLGMVAALIGSLLFLVLGVWLIPLEEDPWIPAIGWVDASLLYWISVAVLAGFLCALVPGSAGGGAIALLLRTLAYRGKVTTRADSIVGVVVGTSAGCATVLITEVIAPNFVWVEPEAVVLAIAIAALAGLLHSWLLGRWLRARLTGSVR